MIGIYKITNKINNKFYIGQSKNVKRRIIEHKCVYHETNKSLKAAYKKYGIENFDFEILEQCDLEKLNEREKYWIKELKPQYNRTTGGDGSPNHCVDEKTRQILKQKGKEFWNNLDDETKNKIINQNLKGPAIGHKVSEETRKKLREYNLGKKQSKETIEKRKQTIALKKINGYVQTNQNHRKKVICIETGEIFSSLKDAKDKYNLSTLCEHLKGRYKTCKGKHYKYYQENGSVTTNHDECSDVG